MRHPVIVRLRGRLGNQMFQYAMAAALAESSRAAVVLDPRELPRAQQRAVDLLALRVSARLLPRTLALRFPSALLPLARRQPRLQPLLRTWVERSLAFDPVLAGGRPPLLLSGYFQSERYFAALRPRLRAEFLPAAPLSARQAALAERISSTESVAVHVRRGDYVDVPAHTAVHGLCSAAYFERAAQAIRARAGEATHFVFSDDPAWARRHVRLPGPVVHVEGQAGQPAVDLHLMARCRHHICSNSSFSWWGAWLGAQPGQCVVAPEPWYASPALDARDLVPPSWLRLPAR